MGKLKFANNPQHMSATPVPVEKNAPLLGEHTFEILGELGYHEEEINKLFDHKIIARKIV
jgi:crotonobetainyl-CoA:carnitine CoA-transferase CaiB-like acyl-CoA transferase